MRTCPHIYTIKMVRRRRFCVGWFSPAPLSAPDDVIYGRDVCSYDDDSDLKDDKNVPYVLKFEWTHWRKNNNKYSSLFKIRKLGQKSRHWEYVLCKLESFEVKVFVMFVFQIRPSLVNIKLRESIGRCQDGRLTWVQSYKTFRRLFRRLTLLFT